MGTTKHLFKPYNDKIVVNGSNCNKIMANSQEMCKVMVNGSLKYEKHRNYS